MSWKRFSSDLLQYMLMGRSQGCLWNERIRYALDKNKKLFTPTDLDWFEKRIGPVLPSCNDLGVPPWPIGLLVDSLSPALGQ